MQSFSSLEIIIKRLLHKRTDHPKFHCFQSLCLTSQLLIYFFSPPHLLHVFCLSIFFLFLFIIVKYSVKQPLLSQYNFRTTCNAFFLYILFVGFLHLHYRHKLSMKTLRKLSFLLEVVYVLSQF